MTASQQAKKHGLKNLKQVSEMTGVGESTLHNWHKNKTKLFEIVLYGCKTHLENESKPMYVD
jgi:hypothetical protein